MFHYLDTTLENLLNDTAAPRVVVDAEASFATPEKTYKPLQADNAINLFLYEVKENRELRDPEPITERMNGLSVHRRPPLRVDCAYMVTAWSKKTGAVGVAETHRLLGQAFNWLSRFPTIPERYFARAMPPQAFPPPTMVAQMDGAKSAGEFWSALGIPPRPYFNLIVTICMDLDQAVEDAIVTTISTTYQGNDPLGAEARMMVGGTVKNSQGHPVADAWVRLEPQGETQVTDAQGRFIFERVARGQAVTLRARAQGYQEASRTFAELPSLTGEYDLKFA
jgi:hypothetical protein